jgi:hypothetical protein
VEAKLEVVVPAAACADRYGASFAQQIGVAVDMRPANSRHPAGNSYAVPSAHAG